MPAEKGNLFSKQGLRKVFCPIVTKDTKLNSIKDREQIFYQGPEVRNSTGSIGESLRLIS